MPSDALTKKPFGRARAAAPALLLILATGCLPRSAPEDPGATAPPTVPVSAGVEAAPVPGRETTPPPGEAPEGMVWVPGGTFWMGMGDAPGGDSEPVHLVKLDGFWMDRTEVTNAQFAAFVKATGYVTVAERVPTLEDYPGAPPENLVAGSIVFTPPDEAIPLDNHLAWWGYVHGASWRHPEGPDSSIEGKDNYPVVHVCYEDIEAYARWAGKQIPTEAQWEYAARGGLDRKRYVWGDELIPNGNWQVNNWQGRFPVQNVAADGFTGVAPVASYPPNGYGLHDMAGNVWEWCADWYRPGYEVSGSKPEENPEGPSSSHDPMEPGVKKRVQRGGSYLCSDMYCTRYLPGARGKAAIDSGTTHAGFRCIKVAGGPVPSATPSTQTP